MRVTFLIDGFNLYHSLLDAEKDGAKSSKWLDVDSLMRSYLPHIDNKAKLEEIYFFTAYRNHIRAKNPQTVKRHERYIKILKSKGVKVVLGKFKESQGWCSKCSSYHKKFEEKETDVNIAVRLVELAYLNNADTFVIVSGDTDLIPGVDVVRRQFTDKEVHVIFPYKRKNDDFLKRVGKNFKLKKETYSNHQFTDPISIEGVEYKKPIRW
jgi:uncharacterized LabA/DUF88 family protein